VLLFKKKNKTKTDEKTPSDVVGRWCVHLLWGHSETGILEPFLSPC